MDRLLVVTFLLDQAESVPPLIRNLESLFTASIKVAQPSLNLEAAYNPTRCQYYSTAILHLLSRKFASEPGKILGVTSVDLFVPILTFVFGEAHLNGPAAVVSTHRLRNEYYGLPPDNRIMEERLIKESMHELGHTFGMIHCNDSNCVMHASTYVEEIDLKSEKFCRPCYDATFGNKT